MINSPSAEIEDAKEEEDFEKIVERTEGKNFGKYLSISWVCSV